MYPSILGPLYIVVSDDEVEHVFMGNEDWATFYSLHEDELVIEISPLMHKVIKQLDEYFEGGRKTFDLPLAEKGTAFQKSVWKVLRNIPYGETISYLDVAKQINNPKSVRAVGQANRANPLPIIVPCHRVIGKNKGLTGYAGNKVDLKEKLLILEGVMPKQ
jgi:methylated-DNA-[protein]-cysteine S-methyltransferase